MKSKFIIDDDDGLLKFTHLGKFENRKITVVPFLYMTQKFQITIEIYLPSGYVSAQKNPYVVKYLDHSFFRKFRDLNYFKTVTNLRALKYNPDGKIEFKLHHSDEWTDLSITQRKRPSPNTSHNFQDEG